VQPYVSTQRQSASTPPLMEVYEETKAARGAALRQHPEAVSQCSPSDGGVRGDQGGAGCSPTSHQRGQKERAVDKVFF
jgi:hypothetical protein